MPKTEQVLLVEYEEQLLGGLGKSTCHYQLTLSLLCHKLVLFTLTLTLIHMDGNQSSLTESKLS